MLKIMSYTKYKKLVEGNQTHEREKGNLYKRLKEQESTIQELIEENEKLLSLIEEEKEKYKKYVKQMRTKKTNATKKWLNGYPDE